MSGFAKLGKFVAKVRDEGLGAALGAVGFWLRMKTGIHRKNPVEERRLALAMALNRDFGSTVRYGPLRGMQLASDG